MRSCVTISLVKEASGGPFVFWDDLPEGCAQAAELGFDAIEIFAPSRDSIDVKQLKELLDRHGLTLAAAGTGAGWVKHQWHLCHSDRAIREKARNFVQEIIDLAAEFNASAILGSMQGRTGPGMDSRQAHDCLVDELNVLGEYAGRHQLPLLFEPINRYETDLINRIDDGLKLLSRLDTTHVKLLADLFHMNIEEASIADALRLAGVQLGHVHFADSNRRAAGLGHIDYAPIIQALEDIEYQGYLSAEVFALPSPAAAAAQTIKTLREILPAHEAASS